MKKDGRTLYSFDVVLPVSSAGSRFGVSRLVTTWTPYSQSGRLRGGNPSSYRIYRGLVQSRAKTSSTWFDSRPTVKRRGVDKSH